MDQLTKSAERWQNAAKAKFDKVRYKDSKNRPINFNFVIVAREISNKDKSYHNIAIILNDALLGPFS